MVQKPASYNRDPASNAFADDDPLAELARLVGYDAPRSDRVPQPRVEPEMSASHAGVSHADPSPVGTGYAAPRQPADHFEDPAHLRSAYNDERQRLSAFEPVSFGASPARAVPQDDGVSSESDLADELLWSMGEVAAEPQRSPSGGTDASEGYNRFRLPLANFNPVPSTPTQRDEPPMQRSEALYQPASEPEPDQWAVASEPPVVRPTAPVYAAPSSPAAASERHREPDFDSYPVSETPTPDLSFSRESERRPAPAAFPEPVFEAPAKREAPNFFNEPSFHAEEPRVAQTFGAEPQMASSSAGEDDFFAGDLELDLAEIELDLADMEPEPVFARATPEPVPAQAPISRAPEPVYQAPKPAQAAAQVPQPDYRAPSHDAQPDLPAPPLPFDASAISDQDEHLEVIAHLDVPDLPPPEEEKPVNYVTEYDFDIDAELANLLDKTAEQQAQQPAPVAHQAPAAVATSAQMPQPKNSLSDDFDVFEKALEEDFRRTLDTQYNFGAKKAGALPEVPEIDDEEFEEEERSSSRRWIAIAAAAAIVLVGGGGVFAWMKSGGGEILGGGEPKIVMADKDPVKVVPANPGGKSVPNQNKAVYDRVSGATTDQPAQKNLISQDEEPMDVAQRTLGPDNLPLDDEGGGANAEAGANPANGGATNAANSGDENLSPRRVKTMIVRPDGTLVAQDDLANAGAQTANAPATATPAATPASTTASTTGQSVGDLLASGDAQPDAAAATADDFAGVPAPNMPVPMTRPTQTASAQPVAEKPATEKLVAPSGAAQASVTAPVASTSTAPGEYLIQISSLPTEADAQKSYKNLSTKYSSVIGGRGMNIKAAEVAGKGTYYRVRIPAGSKDAAVSLCERYRAAGGSCMVVR